MTILQHFTTLYIFAAIGGVLGGLHNIVRTRKRCKNKNLTADFINLAAGVFAAFIAVDVLIPPDKILWSPFVGMSAGAVGGYFIDALIVVAPSWIGRVLPSLLDNLMLAMGYAKKPLDSEKRNE